MGARRKERHRHPRALDLRAGAGDREAAAAIEYLTFAFKVFASGIRPEAAKAGDQPYLSLDLSKDFPLIPKMMRGQISYEELDQEDMVIVGDPDHGIRKLER